MDREEIFCKSREIVSDMFDVDMDSVALTSDADQIDGWDSLAHATLVLKLERVFDVELPNTQAFAAQNVGDLVGLIATVSDSGRKSKLADTVFAGDDDHLFHRDHGAVEQMGARIRLADGELDRWVTTVETRHAWCRARGIPYIHMVVPEKHAVYSDRLPAGIALSPQRPVYQIVAGLDGGTRRDTLYPLRALQQGRATHDTYFKTDTHWNMYGGFIAYRQMMEAAQRYLPLTPVSESDLVFEHRDYVGDLGVRVDPEPRESGLFLGHKRPQPFKLVLENKIFNRGSLQVWETEDRSLPKAVIFRDSFSNYIIPHMIPCFSRLTAVGSLSIFYDLLKREQPDIVFFEVAERYLALEVSPGGQKVLPEDLHGTTFHAFSGVSLDRLGQGGDAGV